MGVDYARSVVPYEELYMPLLQEVQDLKEGRDCLVLSLDDGRQLLFLDDFQGQLCLEEVMVDLRIKVVHGIVILVVFARNVHGAQLEKRFDALRSCCLVRGMGCLRCDIEAQRPIYMDGNLVVLGQKGDEKKIAKLFQSSGDGGTWEGRRACRPHPTSSERD